MRPPIPHSWRHGQIYRLVWRGWPWWTGCRDRSGSPDAPGYIQSLYVAPTDRGRGVGTRLVQELLDHAGGLGLDDVAVHPSENAFSLYERLGFSRTDRTLELRWR